MFSQHNTREKIQSTFQLSQSKKYFSLSASKIVQSVISEIAKWYDLYKVTKVYFWGGNGISACKIVQSLNYVL